MTKKNRYITTAIPYANAKPHIGNAIDYLLADIWARYHRAQGENVRFQVGTDEHGNKIAAKAAENNQSPKEFLDAMVPAFKAMMDKENIAYTDFIRTTDVHHMATSQFIWQRLESYLYKKSYEGWYCVGHEAFVTDREATETNGVCPDHQKPYTRVSEENYFFKLSQFGGKIKEAVETRRMQIVPAFRQAEILKLIDEGLQDVSFSRSKKTLTWGVPVPGDDDQVMYVWCDALVNYLSVIGYPDQEEWKEFWPADVQVVGKDILRFHAAIWPAMLLALDLPLPKTILVHGFVNVGGAKMSKTVGNVVDPLEIIENYGVDGFRYYFSRHIPTTDDGDFTWEKFETAYNNELANELGNAVSRVAKMVLNYQAGVIGDAIQADHDSQGYHDHMKDFEFGRAMDDVWLMVKSLNQFLEEVKPWEIAKKREKDSEAEEHLGEILAHAVGTLVQVADLLAPFLPETSEKIKALFKGGMVHDEQGLVFFPKKHLHTEDPRLKQTAPAKK